MSTIALFHSVLGVRPGVPDAAERLRAAGHDVRVVDQYDGRVFDVYEEAGAYAEEVGYGPLMAMAVEQVADLGDDLVVAGFSNGGGMAQYVATQRPVRGAVMISGILPLEMLGAENPWPGGVPAQLHYTNRDPKRFQEWVDSGTALIRAADVHLETYDYPGDGHLFTDASKADEHQPEEAELAWSRILDFCARWD